MAGIKSKPTALKKLEGNPGKRKLNAKEPVPAKGMPDCPKWLLPEAKEEWKRLCQKLSEMGVLTEIDMAAFAAYCQSYARWKEAQEHIDGPIFVEMFLTGAAFEAIPILLVKLGEEGMLGLMDLLDRV